MTDDQPIFIGNLETNNFIETAEAEEFVCAICYNLMSTICAFDKCGHIYCKKCIESLNQCPLCHFEITDVVYRYHVAVYLMRKLRNLQIKCPGCNDVLLLRHFKNHTKKIINYLNLAQQYWIKIIIMTL